MRAGVCVWASGCVCVCACVCVLFFGAHVVLGDGQGMFKDALFKTCNEMYRKLSPQNVLKLQRAILEIRQVSSEGLTLLTLFWWPRNNCL